MELLFSPMQAIAKRLTNLAHRAGESTELTPFSEAARLAGQTHEGGRRDDMTASVAFVV